jgi:hypothetical protein
MKRNSREQCVVGAAPAVAPCSPSPARSTPRTDVALLLFLTVWGTCAYFWQSRDWNNASRLMLTYALVDRGTLHIDGLQMHAGDMRLRTGDLAVHGDHFYTEKAPGQSFLGVPAYAMWKGLTGYGGHPLNTEAHPYWPQDYWVTLFTSGLATACAALLVYAVGLRFGAGQGGAVLLALAYGLGTHALVYGTLFYGHQAAAACVLGSFLSVPTGRAHASIGPWSRAGLRSLAAGLLAGLSVVIELTLLPAALLVGFELLRRQRRTMPGLVFGLGAAASLSVLLWYHWAAFGTPFTTGYHQIWDRRVREVHGGLGLFGPNWSVLPELLWRPRRGLFVYAPVTVLGVAALGVMAWRRRWDLCVVPGGALLSLLLVNTSHFYWAGGLATGPRFLLPALPLLMVPLAAWIGMQRPASAGAVALRGAVAALGLLGAVLALSCALTGGRFGPINDRHTGVVSRVNPLLRAVLPALTGKCPYCRGTGIDTGGALCLCPAGQRLLSGEAASARPDGPQWTRTAVGELFGAAAWIQIAMLPAFLAVLGGLLWVRCRRGGAEEAAQRRGGQKIGEATASG